MFEIPPLLLESIRAISKIQDKDFEFDQVSIYLFIDGTEGI